MLGNTLTCRAMDKVTARSALSLLVSVFAGMASAQEGSFQMPPARVEVAAAELRDMAPSKSTPAPPDPGALIALRLLLLGFGYLLIVLSAALVTRIVLGQLDG